MEDSFSIGAVKSGKVTDITDQGVYVELAEGVEGLIRIEEEDEYEAPDFDSGSDIQVRVLEFIPESNLLFLALVPPSSVGE